jgi:hypothetical protein
MSTTDFQASLDEGLAHFGAARFFEAHDAWEAGWRTTCAAEKQLLQVLVLWAGAYHHARRGNRSGAVKLMHRALEKLEKVDGAQAPFEVEALREALVSSWEMVSLASPLQLVPPSWRPEAIDAGAEEVELFARTSCPYCGEPVAVEVDAELAGGAEYVEDCPVCCHPWTVVVRDSAGQVSIGLRRGDD